MKKLMTLITLLITSILFSQSGINYKAVIKDGGGNVLANSLIVVQFTVNEATFGGTTVYQENHTPTTDANGLVILNIGEGTPISGTFATIDWGNADHFLNVQVNSGGGLTDLGTTQFMAVPYALSAPPVSINDLTDGKATTTTIALGTDAGLNNSNASGTENTFVGINAGKSNTTGNNNTYIGTDSGASSNVGTGINNVTLGSQSGAALTDGNNNVILGANAGTLVTSGTGNVIIGSSAGDAQNYSNKLLIDNTGTTTPLVYGEFDNNQLFINRNYFISSQEVFGVTRNNVNGADYGGMYVETKGIGNTSRPFYGFAINGISKSWIEHDGASNNMVVSNSNGNFSVRSNTASKPVAGSWIANSDERLKKSIIPLDKEEMLQKILKMKGVSYEWNDTVTDFERPDGKQIGFIAQDLQKIWPEKVSEDHLGYLQTAYGDYDAVIIEAIKALNEKIERQELEIDNLKRKVSEMEVDKKQLAEF